MDGLDCLGADDLATKKRHHDTIRGALIGAVIAQVGVFLFGRRIGVEQLGPRSWRIGRTFPSFAKYAAAVSTGAGVGAGVGYALSRRVEAK